jgi:hypothetical protein
MIRLAVSVVVAGALVVVAGCGKPRDPNAKPAGTSADPVLVCERLADVCKLDDARLGVCTQGRDGKSLVCASQH